MRLSGSANALQYLQIEGLNDTSGYCVEVIGDNALIDHVRVNKCGRQSIRVAGTNGTFSNNDFDHTGAALLFQYGGSCTAKILSNHSVSTASTDVWCSNNYPAGNFTGSGNTNTVRPPFICNANCNCPAGIGN